MPLASLLERQAFEKALREGKSSRRARAELARRASGYVVGSETIYFIRMGEDGPIKIGRTRDVQERLAGLQTANPYKLSILATIVAPTILELQIHAYFNEYRLEGEWFEPQPEVLEFVDLIKSSNLDEILTRFEKRVTTIE